MVVDFCKDMIRQMLGQHPEFAWIHINYQCQGMPVFEFVEYMLEAANYFSLPDTFYTSWQAVQTTEQLKLCLFYWGTYRSLSWS